MLTIIVSSIIDFMIEIKEKLKRLQWTKRAENLHNHVHAAILPTDAFKLQISAQKDVLRWSFFLSDKEKTKSDSRAYL